MTEPSKASLAPAMPPAERSRPLPEAEVFEAYLRNIIEPSPAEKPAPEDTAALPADSPATEAEPPPVAVLPEKPEEILPAEVQKTTVQEMPAAPAATELPLAAEIFHEPPIQAESPEVPEPLPVVGAELPDPLLIETDEPETAGQIQPAETEALPVEETSAEQPHAEEAIYIEADSEILPDVIEASPELPEVSMQTEPVIELITERIHELGLEPRKELLITVEAISKTLSTLQGEAELSPAETQELEEQLEALCIELLEQLELEPDTQLVGRLKEIVMASAAMPSPVKLTLQQLWEEGTHEQLASDFQQLKSLLNTARSAPPRLHLLGRLAVRFKPLFISTADAGVLSA